MTQDETFYGHLFDGLRELAESSFPKKCASCGKVFESAKQFFLETQHINAATTGLKQAQDDDGSQIVEAFRNCLCGSTLMEFFNDRRDISEAGNIRRKKFDYLLNLLQGEGLDSVTARIELLKVLRGEKSEILSKIRPPTARDK